MSIEALQPHPLIGGVDLEALKKEGEVKPDSKEAFRKFLASQKEITFSMMQMANNPADMLSEGGGNASGDIMKAVTSMSEIMKQEFKLEQMDAKANGLALQRQATGAAMIAAYGGKFVDVPVSTIEVGKKVRFDLPKATQSAEIVIMKAGEVVLKKPLDTTTKSFVWKGEVEEGEDAVQLGEAYDVEVRAFDGKNNSSIPLRGQQAITKIEQDQDGAVKFKAGGHNLTQADLAKLRMGSLVGIAA